MPDSLAQQISPAAISGALPNSKRLIAFSAVTHKSGTSRNDWPLLEFNRRKLKGSSMVPESKIRQANVEWAM